MDPAQEMLLWNQVTLHSLLYTLLVITRMYPAHILGSLQICSASELRPRLSYTATPQYLVLTTVFKRQFSLAQWNKSINSEFRNLGQEDHKFLVTCTIR